MTNLRDKLDIKPRPKLLRDLAKYLETKVPAGTFCMHDFCGTERCAFGHAPSVPSIRKLGLRYAVDCEGYPTMRLRAADDRKIFRLRSSSSSDFDPDLVSHFARAQFVFGITALEAGRVFGQWTPGEACDPKPVAKRLRALANKYDHKGV